MTITVLRKFGSNGVIFSPDRPFARPEEMTDFTIIHLFANKYLDGVMPEDIAPENHEKLFNCKRFTQIECANCRRP